MTAIAETREISKTASLAVPETPQKMAAPEWVREIAATVAAEHGVPFEVMFAVNKKRKPARARQEAMRRVKRTLRQYGLPSYPQVGAWFGCHHSTVIYACAPHRG